MRYIEINSDSWYLLIEDILVNFSPGELISHKWLKDKFHLKELLFEDYTNTEEFIQAFQTYQFDYMVLVDTLRWQLLEGCKIYLKNIYREGYAIIPPDEQVKHGYEKFIKEVKNSMKKSDLIINNVLPVSAAQQAADNDIKARYSLIKQMLEGIK